MNCSTYQEGRFRAFSDHLFRGAAYVKRKARRGITGHSREFVDGYLSYARDKCCIRRRP